MTRPSSTTSAGVPGKMCYPGSHPICRWRTTGGWGDLRLWLHRSIRGRTLVRGLHQRIGLEVVAAGGVGLAAGAEALHPVALDVHHALLRHMPALRHPGPERHAHGVLAGVTVSMQRELEPGGDD